MGFGWEPSWQEQGIEQTTPFGNSRKRSKGDGALKNTDISKLRKIKLTFQEFLEFSNYPTMLFLKRVAKLKAPKGLPVFCVYLSV
jgi:hypothetical protein